MRFRIGLVAAVTIVAAPLGHRAGVLPLSTAVPLLAAGVLLSLGSLVRWLTTTVVRVGR